MESRLGPGSAEPPTDVTPSTPKADPDLKGAMEGILSEGVTVESLVGFVKSLEKFSAAEHKLSRSHSFQLVKLQSEVHELRCQRAKDEDKISGIRSEVQDLYKAMADLKGLHANLTIEMHALKNTAPRPRQGSSTPKSVSQSASNGDSNVWSTVQEENEDIVAMADKLLLEQRPRLIQVLRSAADIAECPEKFASSNASLGVADQNHVALNS